MAEYLKIAFSDIEKIELIGGTKAQTLRFHVGNITITEGTTDRPDVGGIVGNMTGITISDTIVDGKCINTSVTSEGNSWKYTGIYEPRGIAFNDEGKMKMRPAVELSYLDEDCQRDLVDEIDLNDCTPSHDQTIRMRKMFEEGKLTPEAIQAIMSEQKPNQREKIVLRGDRVRQLIPKSVPLNQTEDFVCKALEHYNNFLRKRAERDTR